MCVLKTWKVFVMVISSKDMVARDPSSKIAITPKVKINRWWGAIRLRAWWLTSSWPRMVTIKLTLSLCSNWHMTRRVAQSSKWPTLRRVRNRVAPMDTQPEIKAMRRTLCKWACNRRCSSCTSKSSNRPRPFSRTSTSTTSSDHNAATWMNWRHPDKTTTVTMRSLNFEKD